MTLRIVMTLCALTLGVVTARGLTQESLPFDPATPPLAVARVLAARYPASPVMSYIPAVAWSSSLRLAELTGEERWKDRPRREMQAFILGEKAAIAEPYLLTSLAGHLALADLAAIEPDGQAQALARKAAEFILADQPGEVARFRRNWTDDMFMASSLLARVGARETNERYGRAVGELLTSYANTLQRADGLFIHAADGPYAWGRGNGFALMGLAEALTHLPPSWSERARVLAIYRSHVGALLRHQQRRERGARWWTSRRAIASSR